MTTTRRATTYIGLLFTLAITFLPLGTWGLAHSGLGPPWGREVFFWALTIALLAYVLLVERRPLSSIGFRRPGVWDIVWGVVTGGVIVVGLGAIFGLLFPLLHLKMNTGTMNTLLHTPIWYRVALVTRAAVTEEILYRGYPMERLRELTGTRWIGAVLTLAAFTYAHLSGWGPAHLLIAGSAGLFLTLLYLWRRNLWVNMLAHWITDGVGFLLQG